MQPRQSWPRIRSRAENEVLQRENAALREQLAKELPAPRPAGGRAARAAAETAQEQPAPKARQLRDADGRDQLNVPYMQHAVKRRAMARIEILSPGGQ